MTQGLAWKKLALAALCLIVLLTLSACNKKEEPPNFDMLSIVTFAPASVPATGDQPGAADGWNDFGLPTGTAAGMAMGTPAPTPMPTPAPTASPSPSPTPSNVLRYGDSGDKVLAVQKRLKDLGYLTGKADGDFGYGTEDAVKAFQRANGLSGDGVVGARTLDKLNSSKAKKKTTQSTTRATSVPKAKVYTPSEPDNYRYLQLGSSGKDVTKLQNRLIALGYLSSKANGSYDEATKNAVIAFQERNGQWVDGVAGEDTQTRLFSDKALAARGGSND